MVGRSSAGELELGRALQRADLGKRRLTFEAEEAGKEDP